MKIDWTKIDLNFLLGDNYESQVDLYNILPNVFKGADQDGKLASIIEVMQDSLDEFKRKIAVLNVMMFDVFNAPNVVLLKLAKLLNIPQNIIDKCSEDQLRGLLQIFAKIHLNKGKADVLKDFFLYFTRHNCRIRTMGFFDCTLGDSSDEIYEYLADCNDFFSLYMDDKQNDVIVDCFWSDDDDDVLLVFFDYFSTISGNWVYNRWTYYDIYPFLLDYYTTNEFCEIVDSTQEFKIGGLIDSGGYGSLEISRSECYLWSDYFLDILLNYSDLNDLQCDFYVLYIDSDNYIKVNVNFSTQTIEVSENVSGSISILLNQSCDFFNDRCRLQVFVDNVNCSGRIYVDGSYLNYFLFSSSLTEGTVKINNIGDSDINIKYIAVKELR